MASQGRNEKSQNFARLLRHSQLYEVFINERLKLASQDYRTSDNFECKVTVNVSQNAAHAGCMTANNGALLSLQMCVHALVYKPCLPSVLLSCPITTEPMCLASCCDPASA